MVATTKVFTSVAHPVYGKTGSVWRPHCLTSFPKTGCNEGDRRLDELDEFRYEGQGALALPTPSVTAQFPLFAGLALADQPVPPWQSQSLLNLSTRHIHSP